MVVSEIVDVRSARAARHRRYRAVTMSDRTVLFPRLFTAGSELSPKKGKKPHVVRLQPIGPLHLPSGRLVIHGTYERFPLVRTAPIGVFPVEASLVTVSSSESRFAATRIVFSREPVATWEIADGEFGAARGFVIPTCVYIDAQLVPAMQKYMDEADSPDEWYFDPPKQEGETWQSACFAPDDDRPETVAMFRMYSYGDGPYISYWGLDANGAPAMFVTDLNVVS
ncbi:MAG: DUF4241 domain-containing protein [Kofleriaceae bacterium]